MLINLMLIQVFANLKACNRFVKISNLIPRISHYARVKFIGQVIAFEVISAYPLWFSFHQGNSEHLDIKGCQGLLKHKGSLPPHHS